MPRHEPRNLLETDYPLLSELRLDKSAAFGSKERSIGLLLPTFQGHIPYSPALAEFPMHSSTRVYKVINPVDVLPSSTSKPQIILLAHENSFHKQGLGKSFT